MPWPALSSPAPVGQRRPSYNKYVAEYKATVAHGQIVETNDPSTASLIWVVDDFRSHSYSQLFSFPWAKDTVFKLEFLIPNEKSSSCRINLRVVKGCDHHMDFRVMILMFDEAKNELGYADEDVKFVAVQDYRRNFRRLKLDCLLNKEGFVKVQRLNFTIMVKSKQIYDCPGERFDLRSEKSQKFYHWNSHRTEIIQLAKKHEAVNSDEFGLNNYPKYADVLFEPDLTFYIGSLPHEKKNIQASVQTNRALIRKVSPIWADMIAERQKGHIHHNIDLVFDGRKVALSSLLRLITYGKVDCSDDVLHEVLMAAEKYQIYGVKKYCEEKFIATLDSHNLARRLCLTAIFDRKELLKKCVEWMNTTKFTQSAILKTVIEKLPAEAYSRIANELLTQYLNRQCGNAGHRITSSGDSEHQNSTSEGDTFYSTEMTFADEINEDVNSTKQSQSSVLDSTQFQSANSSVESDT